MFNKNLNPNDLLRYVFSDMKDVLAQMRDSGLDMSNTPPHATSVYLLLNEEDPSTVGVGRSDPKILTDFDKSDWGAIALFNLESCASSERIPLGSFIGFIDTYRFSKSEDLKHLDIFVGILISKDGSERVGCYSKLDNFDASLNIQPSALDDFSFLQNIYVSSTDTNNSH